MQIRFALVALLALPFIAPASAQPRYTITDLDAGSKQFSVAAGLNNLGDVVGDSNFHAFVWSDGTMVTPPSLATGFSTARAVNNLRQVVGGHATASGASAAFVLQNGVVTDLALPAGTNYSLASAINDRGQIVVNGVADSKRKVWLWSEQGLQEIPILGGNASGLNERGDVVGAFSHAFRWSDGQITDLGVLPGGESENYSSGNAINDAGQVVGVSSTADQPHAFIWNQNVMTDLGTLPGDNRSYAASINNRGQVVGWSGKANGVIVSGVRAVLWDRGTVYNLEDLIPPGLGWTLDQASGINDRGQIAGIGHRGGLARGFILNPVQREGLLDVIIPRKHVGPELPLQ